MDDRNASPPPDPATGGPGFADHFSGCADLYARFRPRYPTELGDRLVSLLPDERIDGSIPHRSPLVWEAGCGSGQFTRLLASRFDPVVATDASVRQLARAPGLPGVHYLAARAEASALSPGVASLVVAAQAAHWFEPAAFYAEARRVASPGAGIALVSYGAPTLEGPPGPLLERFHRVALERDWPPERRLVDDGYRSLPFPFDEVPQAPIDIVHAWTRAELIGYVRTWSAVGRMVEREGDEAFVQFEEALAEAWGAPSAPRSVRWPLAVRAGRIPG